MNIEVISSQNLKQLVELVLELWNDCSFDEEVESYKAIIDSENENVFSPKTEPKTKEPDRKYTETELLELETEELKQICQSKNIKFGNTKSKDKLINKILKNQ